MKHNLSRLTIRIFLTLVSGLFASGSFAAVTGAIAVEQFQNSSSTANSTVTYQVVLSGAWSTSTVTSLILKNDAGTVMHTHSGATNPMGVISNLPTAHYKFTATILAYDGSTLNLSQDIWVGNRVLWENCFDMQQGVSQYSLLRSKATSGQGYSYAQSFNQLASGTDGWVEMCKFTNGNAINDSHIFWVLEPLADPRTFAPTDNITYVEFHYTNSTTTGIRVRYKKASGTWQTDNLSATLEDKIRFVRTGSTSILQKGSSTTAFFTFPVNIAGALKITVLGKQVGDQADYISSSFAYPSANYPIATTNFNTTASTNTGELTTRIAPYSGYVSPYNYFVSREPIANMKEVYKYLKDTIYPDTGVDSTTFFQGQNATTTNVSPQVPSGTYHTAVFDSKGVRIFGNTIDIVPDLTFDVSNRMSNSYNEFLSFSNDSYMTARAFTTEQENSTLTFYFNNIAEDQSYGLVDQSTTISTGNSYAAFKYGIRVMGGYLYQIDGGTVSGSPMAQAKANVPVEMILNGGTLEYRSEGTLLTSVTLPTDYSYKSGMYVKKWGVRARIVHNFFSFRPFSIGTSITGNACGSTTGNIRVVVTPFLFQSLTNVNLALKNYTDETVTPLPTVATVTASPTNLTNLPLGVYSLEGTVTVGGTVYTIKQLVYLGSKLSWDPYVNLVTWPGNAANTNYAVATNAVSSSNTAKAISANKLPASTAGWMVFTPQIPSPLSPVLTGVTLSFSEAPIMGSQAFDYTMPVVHIIGGFGMWSTTTASTTTNYIQPVSAYVPNIPTLMARYANGTVKIRQNYNVLRTVTNFTNARWKPAFIARRANNGVINCLASFQCSSYANDQFAQLKYDMDGYYHVMKNGEIKFVFDQEYDAANLKFNLYSSNDILIRTQANFPVLATTHGMNYLTINVTGSACIGSGFFYLEVINSKNEKMYLRFHNDYTGCTPPVDPEQGGLQGQ